MKFNGRNVHISKKAKIGSNVKIGDNTVIYDNVIIGDDTIICNNCIIGEPHTAYYYDNQYENSQTIIGKNSLIRSHAIIYAGNKIGENLITGHRITVRINNKIGKNCTIGNYTEIYGNVTLGNYVKLQSDVGICEDAVVKNFVIISPGSKLINDPVPPSYQMVPPAIDDFAFLGVNVCIFPGVKIGKHCLIGADAVVKRNTEDYSVMIGDPAKKIADIRQIRSHIDGTQHYPWPYSFSTGMPWEEEGFEQWRKKNIVEAKRKF